MIQSITMCAATTKIVSVQLGDDCYFSIGINRYTSFHSTEGTWQSH